MNYKLLIVFILFSFSLLFTQEILEIEDSLRIEVADSLTIFFEQDSLTFSNQDSLLLNENTGIDSLNYPETAEIHTLDIVELHKKLMEFLKEKKQVRQAFQLPMIVEKEDFHWKTPFNPNLHFSKNGFTYFSFQTSNIHAVQNFAPLYNAAYDQGFVDFSLDDYALPVAVTEVFLGLGDINMNHAVMNYKKGRVVGIPDLNIEIGYIGMDGKWLGKREKSRNFNSHLFYDQHWGKIHFYYSNIDQEISSNKLADPPEYLYLMKEQSSETAFKWENPYLDLGYRIENTKVDTLKQELSEILLSKALQYKNHRIKLCYEYFMNSTEDKNFNVFNLSHHSDFSFLDFDNRLVYREKEYYFGSSLLKIKMLSFLQPQFYGEKQAEESSINLWPQERLGAGFILNFPKFGFNAIAGNEKIDDAENPFIETRLNTNYQTGILNLILKNWTLARKTDNIYIPEFQTQTSLEFQLDIQHGNFIKLGVSNIYLSEYGYIHDNQESITMESFSHFEAWLAIQITRQFQIKLDAVNLTNAETLFGLPASENLAGRHFNFNIQWIFIN